MRPSLFLAALLVLAGCVGTGPTVVPVAPSPPAEVAPPPPPPIVVVEPAEVVEVEPVEPPPVPELRIDRRSEFARAGVVEWTLANGLTVVYLHVPEADGYHARIVAPVGTSVGAAGRAAFERGEPRWGVLSARVEGADRVATGEADGVQRLLGDVARLLTAPPDDGGRALFAVAPEVRVFVAGPREREWVEPAVAAELGGLRRGRSSLVATADVPAPSISADWDDLPAALVLDRALADRTGPETGLAFDAAEGRLYLRTDGSTPRPVLLAALSDDALRTARDRAVVQATTPAGRLATLAALYALPGRFTPARDPAEAVGVPSRVARTPPSAAAALLRRLSDAR